jgi:energy-coupling factor transporter ATP-binding protein EcfA2
VAGDAHGLGDVLLSLEDVDAGPVSTPVLRSVSLTLASGEIGVLLGGNGAGKSTLIRTAAGILPPLGGRVAGPGGGGFDPRFAGILLEEPQHQFVSGTVRAEIAFALENLGESRVARRVTDLLERFGLEPLADRDPRTLSAGEQGRALIAAALAPRPRVLFLDDPFLHMGPGDTSRVWDRLRNAVRDREVEALFLATHEGELAIDADRVGILDAGRLQAWGSPDAVLRGGVPPAVDPPLGIWLEGRLGEGGWRLSGRGLDVSSLVRRILADLEVSG